MVDAGRSEAGTSERWNTEKPAGRYIQGFEEGQSHWSQQLVNLLEQQSQSLSTN